MRFLDAAITVWNRFAVGWTCQRSRERSDELIAHMDDLIDELEKMKKGKA